MLISICAADTPKVTPAKVTQTSPSPTRQPIYNPMVTPQEWAELNAAKKVALTAHPELITSAQQLAIRMRQFQKKLKEAMMKENPQIATLPSNPQGFGPNTFQR
jgi:hypothetical protein